MMAVAALYPKFGPIRDMPCGPDGRPMDTPKAFVMI